MRHWWPRKMNKQVEYIHVQQKLQVLKIFTLSRSPLWCQISIMSAVLDHTLWYLDTHTGVHTPILLYLGHAVIIILILLSLRLLLMAISPLEGQWPVAPTFCRTQAPPTISLLPLRQTPTLPLALEGCLMRCTTWQLILAWSTKWTDMSNRTCNPDFMVPGCLLQSGKTCHNLDNPLLWYRWVFSDLMVVTNFSSSSQVNTFQGTVITNGYQSFSVFTYRCGNLQWSGGAVIGFKVSDKMHEIHELTGNNASVIACQNFPRSVWNNIVYQLSESSFVTIFSSTNF